MVLGYSLFNHILRHFALEPESRKFVDLGGTALAHLVSELKESGGNASIVVKEQRTAVIGGGNGSGVIIQSSSEVEQRDGTETLER